MFIQYSMYNIWNDVYCPKAAAVACISESSNVFINSICPGWGGGGGGECQTLSVTFTLRTSLKDVRGHSKRTSGDVLTGCPAMFYFCILT